MMMKKLLFALLGTLLSVSLSAQMMPDSTFQVIAYWEVGDSLSYTCKNQTVKKGSDGTENVEDDSSEIWNFKVVGQTDSTYTMQLTFSDVVPTADVSPGIETEIYRKILERCKLLFVTDEYGSILEFPDLTESLTEMVNSIPLVIDEVSAGYSKKDLKKMGFDKEALTANYEAVFSSPIVVQAFCRAPESLLKFHGTKLDPKEEYRFEDEFDNLMGTGSLKNEVTFWVDPALSDSVSVVIYTASEAGNDKMLPLMQEASLAVLRSQLPEDQWKQAEEELALQFYAGGVDVKFSERTGTEVDLYSGWPVQYHLERQVLIKMGEETNEVFVTQDVRIKKSSEAPAPEQ